MTPLIGFDIGGTKIAGGLFSADGALLRQETTATPRDYDSFLQTLAAMAEGLRAEFSKPLPIGIGSAGAVDPIKGSITSGNMPFLRDRTLREDLAQKLQCRVRIANDAGCMALAEATDGAGQGFDTVFGLIAGTGIGGGLVVHGRLLEGPNGLAGEIGHVALPFREEVDGPVRLCGCGHPGDIESSIQGAALSALYHQKTGRQEEARQIATMADAGDCEALAVLDRYYEVFAKAMGSVIYAYDPCVIVVGGGLSHLSKLYTEVPKRWDRYCVVKNLRTRLVPAAHGAGAGLRGAAWLVR